MLTPADGTSAAPKSSPPKTVADQPKFEPAVYHPKAKADEPATSGAANGTTAADAKAPANGAAPTAAVQSTQPQFQDLVYHPDGKTEPHVIPLAAGGAPVVDAKAPVAKLAAPAEDVEKDPDGKIEHKVVKDEYLLEIARQYKVTIDDIKIANPRFFPPGRDPDIIHPGETVIILDKTRRDNAVAMKDAVDAAHAEQAKLDDLKKTMGVGNYNRLRRNDPDMEAGLKDAWAKVRELATMDMYYAGTNSRTPIDGVGENAEDITSRFAGDKDVAAQVNAAKAEVTRVWTATGRTAEVQDKLDQLTGNVNAAKTSGQGVEQAQQQLQDYLVTLMEAAKTNNAGSRDPLVRIAGVIAQSDAAGGQAAPEDVLAQQLFKESMMPAGERAVRSEALVLSAYGPDDPAFVSAVEAAQTQILVDKPAQIIADAKKNGGPATAMAKLRELTGRDVATEDTAAAIMRKAMPTVQEVLSDMSTYDKTGNWSNLPPGVNLPSEYNPTVPIGDGDRLLSAGSTDALAEKVFADLSAASDHAFYGQGGKEVVRDVASSIIQPPNMGPTDWDASATGVRLFYQAVAAGEGAALQFETIKQLKDSGHTEDAKDLTALMGEGVSKLKEGIVNSVEQFTGKADHEGSGQEFINLVADWSGLLPDYQLSKAIDAYVTDHPDKIKDMEADLDKIGIAGYASVQLERAWGQYKGDLQGLEGADRIDHAVTDMKNDKDKVAFARSSPIAVQELARQDLNSVDVLQSQLFVQPASTVRSLTKAAAGGAFAAYAQINKTRNPGEELKPLPLNSRAGIFVNGSASLLAGGAAGLLFSNSGSLTDQLYAGYFTGSFAKEGFEATAGYLVLKNKAKAGGYLTRMSEGKAPTWKIGAKAFSVAGAGIDFYTAAVSASKGGWENYVSAGLSFTSGAAGIASLFVGGPVPAVIGAVAVLGSFGFNEWRNIERANHYEGPTKEFLTAAGLNSKIAEQLANYDGDGLSAAARLEPLAKHLGIPPQQLVSWLNQQDAEFVGDFVKKALHPVTPDDNRNFEDTDPDGDLRGQKQWNPPDDPGGPLTVLKATPDGKYLVEVNDKQSVMTAQELLDTEKINQSDLRPESLEGIVLWAQIHGHNLRDA